MCFSGLRCRVWGSRCACQWQCCWDSQQHAFGGHSRCIRGEQGACKHMDVVTSSPYTQCHKLFVASKPRCNVQHCYLRRRETLLLTVGLVVPSVRSTTQGSPGPMSGTKVIVSHDVPAVQPHTHGKLHLPLKGCTAPYTCDRESTCIACSRGQLVHQPGPCNKQCTSTLSRRPWAHSLVLTRTHRGSVLRAACHGCTTHNHSAGTALHCFGQHLHH